MMYEWCIKNLDEEKSQPFGEGSKKRKKGKRKVPERMERVILKGV